MVKPLKDKKCKEVLNAVIEIVNECIRKPNKLWVDQGRELYHKLMQDGLDNNNISTHSTYNEGDSVIVGRFIRPLKAKIYKKITANDSIWLKKDNRNFDVTMQSFDGAEMCQLVDLYLLKIPKIEFGRKNLKLGRDDGCSCFKNKPGSELEKSKRRYVKFLR